MWLIASALTSENLLSTSTCMRARESVRGYSESVATHLTRSSCPSLSRVWHHQKSKTASAYIRMSFAGRPLGVAAPDAVLQGGNAAVGSDCETLSLKPDKTCRLNRWMQHHLI